VAVLGVGICVSAAVLLLSRDGGGSETTHARATVSARGAAPTGLYAQLLGHGEPFVQINTRTGKMSRLELETAGGDWLDRETVTAGRLIWSIPSGTYSVPTSGGERRKLAPVPFVLGSEPDRVWFLIHHGRQSGPGRPTVIIQKTAAGTTVSRSRVRVRCEGLVAAALRAHLLCQDGDALAVIDPATGDQVRRLPGVFPLATHGDVVASCSNTCPRLTLGSPEGVVARVRPPSGYRFSAGYDGAFSRDGSWLAVPVARTHAPVNRRVFRIAVIDMRTHLARVIPGPRLQGVYVKFTWSTRGRLFVAAGRGVIQSWRPGDARAHVLRLSTHAQMLDLAAD
jgi:hypothetical protein